MITAAEARAGLADRALLRTVGLAFVLVAIVLVVTGLPAIAGRRFPDPDDSLRMVQVRDLIAGQSWFDLHQHRVDAPHGGVPMHWSRLVDIPLAGVILLLRPLIGQPGAELAAMIAVPLATMGCALFLAGRLAWRLLGRETAAFACLALAMAVPAVTQMRPLRVDHHGWQIVLALVAANGLVSRNPRLGGWAIGLALAASLAISIEGLPLAAVFMAVLALRWLKDADARGWLLHAMLALAGGSVALFLATRGGADLTSHCDAVSPVHLVIFAWGALGVAALAALGQRSLAVALMGFAAVAGGAVAIMLSWAPQCAAGGIVGLDPLVRSFWYVNVAEGQPIWRQQWPDVLELIAPAGVALYATIRLALRGTGQRPDLWRDYALLLAGAVMISLMVARAGAVAAALAAVPLGWQVREWYLTLIRLDRPVRRLAAIAAMGLVLVPAMPFTLLTFAGPVSAAGAASAVRVSDCDVRAAVPVLRSLGGAEALAPFDLGPSVLYESRLKVIATPHHRGNLALREVIGLFLGSDAAAHRALLARGTHYVMLCPDIGEMAAYRRQAPDGFAAHLAQGAVPSWLVPVAAGGSGLRIYRVAALGSGSGL